jgi:hypothetical protein
MFDEDQTELIHKCSSAVQSYWEKAIHRVWTDGDNISNLVSPDRPRQCYQESDIHEQQENREVDLTQWLLRLELTRILETGRGQDGCYFDLVKHDFTWNCESVSVKCYVYIESYMLLYKMELLDCDVSVLRRLDEKCRTSNPWTHATP